MKILGIDSSGLSCSVALASDGVLIGESYTNNKKTHSVTLLPMVEKLLEDVQVDIREIDAIAVSKGPGSFTGLRIGAATAKGLGLALDVPIIGVPTVDVLAYNMWGCKDLVCPLMDARRQQTYSGLYRFTDAGMEIVKAQSALSLEDRIEEINELGFPTVFLGDGVPGFTEYIHAHCNVPFSFAPTHMNRQRAGALVALAVTDSYKDEQVSADVFSPEYLRVSQAQRERMEQKGKLVVRYAIPEDAIELAKISLSSLSDAWSSDEVGASINNAHAKVFVVEEKDKQAIYGYAVLTYAADEGEIPQIAVRADKRRMGCGALMMERVQEFMREQGIKKIFLEVRASNETAKSFYQASGMKEVGVRKGFYREPSEDAHIFCLTLDSDV